MKLFLFAQRKSLIKKFDYLHEVKGIVLSNFGMENLIDSISQLPAKSFVYIDIEPLSETEVESLIHNVLALNKHWYGIIDAKNNYNAVSSLFFRGISDYISRGELHTPITIERLTTIKKWNPLSVSNDDNDSTFNQLDIIEPKEGWDDIHSGKEYTFFIAFIRIEHLQEMKTAYGYKFANSHVNHFFDYASYFFKRENGKLWIRDNNRAMFLFPYSKDNSKRLISCYSLMLNNVLISGEVLKAPNRVRYSIIAHLDNIVYKNQEEAGSSFSDSLNFIFHASESLPNPGRLYVSDTLIPEIPNEINDLFVRSLRYEGHSFRVLKELYINKASV